MFPRRQGAKGVAWLFLCFRVSSFRGWTQCANAPTPNCPDFGWLSRHLQKGGSPARTRGEMGGARLPAPRGVRMLIAAADA